MASIIMSDIAQWLIRLRWLLTVPRRRVRRGRPNLGRLSQHLRRDVGLGPDGWP